VPDPMLGGGPTPPGETVDREQDCVQV
jgi:hypothetical protein